MLVMGLIKTVFEPKFVAAHDFELVQVFKTHGTPLAAIDFVSAHRYYMTESVRYKRVQQYVRMWLDKYLLSLALRAAAIPWDNCDFVPTAAVTGGEARVCVL